MWIGHRKEIRKLTFYYASVGPHSMIDIVGQLVCLWHFTLETPMRPQALNITHTALPRKQKMAGCGSHFPEIDEWFQLVCKCSSSKYKRIFVGLKKKDFLSSDRLRLDFWEETVMAEVGLFLSVALVITKTKVDD